MVCPEDLTSFVCIIHFVTGSHFHNSLCKKVFAGGRYFLKLDSTCVLFARWFWRLRHRRNCENADENGTSPNGIPGFHGTRRPGLLLPTLHLITACGGKL